MSKAKDLSQLDIGVNVQSYDSNLTSFVSTFTLPTVDGTANQILKTNGSGTISFSDEALSSGTNTFTSSTSITAGAAVSLKPDGTVKASGVEPSEIGTAVNIETDVDYQFVSYDSVNEKYVYFYREANTTELRAVVATPSGNNLTLGTPVVIDTNISYVSCVSYDTDQNVFLVGARRTNNYQYAYCCAVSGSSITVGGSVVYASRTAYYNFITYCPGRSCHVAYTTDDSVNPTRGYAFTLFTTGNATPGISSLNDIGINYPQGGNMAYNPNESKARAVIRWAQVGQNSNYYTFTVNNTGASSSASPSTNGSPGDYRWTDIGCVYDSVSGATLQFFNNQTISANQCVVVNSSGTRGSVSGMPSGYTPLLVQPNAVVTLLGQSYVLMRDASNFLYLMPFTITGTSVAFGTPVSIVSESTNYALAVVDSPQVGFVYVTSAAATTPVGRIFVPAASNINEFIGLAKSSVSSGASVNVSTLGGVNTEVTSLAPGTKYYLDNAGSLTTASNTGVQVGRALSAAQIMVTGGQG
jgi:hypothetical protein